MALGHPESPLSIKGGKHSEKDPSALAETTGLVRRGKSSFKMVLSIIPVFTISYATVAQSLSAVLTSL